MENPFESIDRRLKTIEELLLNLTLQPTTPVESVDKVLTIGPAAQFLGLTPATIYGLVHERKIPHSKRGKRLYFLEAELREWVRAGRQLTAEQLTDQARQLIHNHPHKRANRGPRPASG